MSDLINKHYNDCYFSSESGYMESRYVFINGNNLEEWTSDNLNIGETGFGTGLNLLVLEDFLKSTERTNLNVTFTSVEKYPLDPSIIHKALIGFKEKKETTFLNHLELYQNLFSDLHNGWNSIKVKRSWGSLTLNLYIGDIIESFNHYPIKNSVWFLDGHSPDKNPEMWSPTVFNGVVLNSKKGATFSTFTAAGMVKRGLRDAGFFVKRRKGFGKKRHMIVGFI